MANSFGNALRWCRRYISVTFLIAVGVMVYVLFFNDNSAMVIYRHEQQIERLKAEIRQYGDTLAYYQELNRRLSTDPATMERVVREQYRMQRPDEDIYVVR